jgi:chemotaxis protein methyltransferase CheR
MPHRPENVELRLLLEAIYQCHHYDFRNYSPSSIKRRLSLALQYFKCNTYSQLQDQLFRTPEILPKLVSYLTVQVSEFFRDPEYFKTIREQVIPHLRTYPSLKIWIAGCSSGEEAYSFAVLLREEGLEDRSLIYATDINSQALKRAEAGIYEIERFPLFTDNHRLSGSSRSFSDYYTAAYEKAVLDKSLKRRILFSDHSIVTDSVFAEMHLISCRNVLIYFNRELQDRALNLFNESLIRKGFLGLGAKETIRFSQVANKFTEFSREERLYQKKAVL